MQVCLGKKPWFMHRQLRYLSCQLCIYSDQLWYGVDVTKVESICDIINILLGVALCVFFNK